MPVAQLDRAFPSEGKGRAFESHQAQKINTFMVFIFCIMIADKNAIIAFGVSELRAKEFSLKEVIYF